MGFFVRHWVTLLIVLPASLFFGILFGTAGTAVHPPLAFVATPLVCAGEVEIESRNYSYRPGQSGVSRSFWCVTDEAGGKPARADITMKTILAAMLVYSLIAFVPLWLIGRLVRRGVGGMFRRATSGAGPSAFGGTAPGEAVDLSGILSRVSEAVRSGNARVQVRQARVDLRGDGEAGLAERLEMLQALHARGLITDAEYAAKKAEILAGL